MYTREASALDLFTDSVRLMGDATLCAVMEFDRRLDARTLEEAAQACLLAHPILHSRLVRGNGPAFWEMVNDVCVPPVQVEKCDGDYYPRVIGPVDPYGPVQFRVRLLRRPSGDVIVINLAHAAADAFGLHTLMSQLLQEYRKPGSICPAKGGIPERDTLWTRELDRTGTPVPPDMLVINPLWPDPFGTSCQPATFHRECISTPVLEAIRARARTFGGNVNDAVMAAYFLAMSDLTGRMGPVEIFFPVNLRQHRNDGSRVMSNQATNVCFALERMEGEGMEEILARVIKETKQLKGKSIGIAEQAVMDAACDPEGRCIHRMVEQMAAMQKAGLADIFISNPGPITLPDCEGLTGAYVCYPGGYMPTTCFVTSTFRGQMTLTMGYQDSERARVGTKKAIDLFRHHLLSLVNGC
ncbi:MAG: hypothetical protein CVV30_05925 [Methanomicrobiales archaeon HGW-Methanomicrobiales-1]|jgi:NRPS condensation-like uncharacterized protein|nr:MAG: hypothetical protein CVV30_05925 [Methanomicrobiales archaeon HGW-Methanomicrobiales-1]